MTKNALVFSLILAVCNAAKSEVSRLIEDPVPVPKVLTEMETVCRVTLVLTLCDSANAPIDGDYHKNTSRKFRLLKKSPSRQIEQTLVLLKSILITSKYNGLESCIEVIIVSDKKEYFDVIQKRIFKTEKWDPSFTRFLKLKFVQANFPQGTEWLRNIYAPCATLRFFLPDILYNYDSVIYADTDIIFLGDIQELWNKFQAFTKTVVIGMSPIWNHSTWTPSEKLSPCIKLNAGIILMNLTRMRETQWTQKMMKVAVENSNKLLLPVQTILDIYYGANPNEIQYLPCHWNFGAINCWTPGYNKDEMLRREGVAVLHGYGLMFTELRRDQPIFHVMYLLFQKTQLNSHFVLANFVHELEVVVRKPALMKRGNRSCLPKFQNFFLTKFQRLLKEYEFKIAANGRIDLDCQSENFCRIRDEQEPKK